MGLSASHTPLPCDEMISFWSVRPEAEPELKKTELKKNDDDLYMIYVIVYVYMMYYTFIFIFGLYTGVDVIVIFTLILVFVPVLSPYIYQKLCLSMFCENI